jgi:hypothetical protein
MQQPSKFSAHPNPFKPEPPDRPEVLKGLFCGRERALRQGAETLRHNWDYDGLYGRDNENEKRPWIIHGESRSGKSHLARRILIELKEGQPDIVTLVVPARERNTAQRVLEMLFQKLRNAFLTRVHGPAVSLNLLLDPMVQDAVRMIDRLGDFERGVETITVAVSRRDGRPRRRAAASMACRRCSSSSPAAPWSGAAATRKP